MPHSLEITWDEATRLAQSNARNMIRTINEAEESYQDLLEMLGGRTDQQVADQLFNTVADASQLQKYVDLKNCMVSIHQIWQAGNNVAVGTKDRFADMRRLS